MATENSAREREYFMSGGRTDDLDRTTLATPIRWPLSHRGQPMKVRQCRRGVYRLPPEMVIPFEMRVPSFWQNRNLRLVSRDVCGHDSVDDVMSCLDFNKVAADVNLHADARQQEYAANSQSRSTNNDRPPTTFTLSTHRTATTSDDEGIGDLGTHVGKCPATTSTVEDAQIYTWAEPFSAAVFDEEWYTPGIHKIATSSESYVRPPCSKKDAHAQHICNEIDLECIKVDTCNTGIELSSESETLPSHCDFDEAKFTNSMAQNSSVQYAEQQITDAMGMTTEEVDECHSKQHADKIVAATTKMFSNSSPQDLVSVTTFDVQQGTQNIQDTSIPSVNKSVDFEGGVSPTTFGDTSNSEDDTDDSDERLRSTGEIVSNDSPSINIKGVQKLKFKTYISMDNIDKNRSDVNDGVLMHTSCEANERSLILAYTGTEVFDEQQHSEGRADVNGNQPILAHTDAASNLSAEFECISPLDMSITQTFDITMVDKMCSDGVDDTAEICDGVDALSGYESGVSITDCASSGASENVDTDTDGTISDFDKSNDIKYDILSSDAVDKTAPCINDDARKDKTETKSITTVENHSLFEENDSTPYNQECNQSSLYFSFGGESTDATEKDTSTRYCERNNKEDVMSAADDYSTEHAMRDEDMEVCLSCSDDNHAAFAIENCLSYFPIEKTNQDIKIENMPIHPIDPDENCSFQSDTKPDESPKNEVDSTELDKMSMDSLDFSHNSTACNSSTDMPELDINLLGGAGTDNNKSNSCDHSPGATSGYESGDSATTFTANKQTAETLAAKHTTGMKRRRRNQQEESTATHRQGVNSQPQDTKQERAHSFMDILAVIFVTFNLIYWLWNGSIDVYDM